MQGPDRLMELCRGGRMHWTGEGWLAEPDEVVDALAREGFQECKREIARAIRRVMHNQAACGRD